MVWVRIVMIWAESPKSGHLRLACMLSSLI